MTLKDETQELLKKTQAGILKSHGRNIVRFLFIKFKTKETNVIDDWLKSLGVTSAYEQYCDTQKRNDCLKNDKRHRQKAITNFYISSLGMNYFDTIIFPDAPSINSIFAEGMKHKNGEGSFNGNKLKDTDEYVEDRYKDDIHAVITIASNNKNLINKRHGEVVSELEMKEVGTVLFREYGERMYNDDGFPKEPFGYRDGITKISFFNKEGNLTRKGKENLKFALIGKKKGAKFLTNGDSLLVFRKLRQNVDLFNKEVARLVEETGLTKETIEGQVMGRFKNGKPILLVENPEDPIYTNDLKKFNEFKIDYESSDEKGLRCPFHAHIRLTNPRDLEKGTELILRRSIPYKYSIDNQGLLFMCFQADIFIHFVDMQSWANKENVYKNIGFDYIVGQGEKRGAQKWNTEWGKGKNVKATFDKVVFFKGGEYFYAPPMKFFRSKDTLQDNFLLAQASFQTLHENRPTV